jgi:hypothetical protein
MLTKLLTAALRLDLDQPQDVSLSCLDTQALSFTNVGSRPTWAAWPVTASAPPAVLSSAVRTPRLARPAAGRSVRCGGGSQRSSPRKARLLDQAEALAQVARHHLILGRALVEARRNCSDLSQAVEGSLGWDRLATNLEAAAEALGADEGDGLEELIGRHASLRRAAAVLFDAFVFRSFKPHDPILTAVDMLRAIYRRERRKLPDRVPTVFLKRSWRKRVRAGTDGFDARAYEVAVLVHLRDRLRAGDIWVEGSRAYRTFDDYLLPRAHLSPSCGRRAGSGSRCQTTSPLGGPRGPRCSISS